MSDFAKDYIEVHERIAAFKKAHPEGALQSEVLRFDDHIVIVKAYAYRTPDDPRPGIGHSSLDIPGKTPYTRGAELENAETSAWGRAIAALGFEVKRGIASAEEVRSKSTSAPVVSSPPAAPAPRPSNPPPAAGESHHREPPPLDVDEVAGGLIPGAPGPTAAEGYCPVHEAKWVLKPAGTTKAGKPYAAFWACPSTERPYCKERPTARWMAFHEIAE
jgi:hypothetical protein